MSLLEKFPCSSKHCINDFGRKGFETNDSVIVLLVLLLVCVCGSGQNFPPVLDFFYAEGSPFVSETASNTEGKFCTPLRTCMGNCVDDNFCCSERAGRLRCVLFARSGSALQVSNPLGLVCK